MNGSRGARLPVGSAPWIAEERSSALQITQSEVEEFSFSARNEFDWLNEHMAEIFTENQMCVNMKKKTNSNPTRSATARIFLPRYTHKHAHITWMANMYMVCV